MNGIKKTLHDVIAITCAKGRSGWMKYRYAVIDDKRLVFQNFKEGCDVVCTKHEHNQYVKQIEHDYNTYKEEFEQKPVFTQVVEDKVELPPVGVECEYFHEPTKDWVRFIPLLITDEDTSPHSIPAIYGEWYHPFDYLWEPDLIDLASEVKFRPIKSPEERLIDEIAFIVDSNFEGVDIAKTLLEKYNITPKTQQR